MNEAENKVKEYIDRGYEILKETQPQKQSHNTTDVILVAQMLQREEHYQNNKNKND